MEKCHVLVVGPGLGRSEETTTPALSFIKIAMEKGCPCVLDGVPKHFNATFTFNYFLGWD